MKRIVALSTGVLAAAFAFAPLAPGQQQPAREPRADAAQEAQREQAGEQGQMNADQAFAREAAADNQIEIQEAQFVAQNGQNQQVKQLAEALVQDHQQAQQQLEQAARQGQLQLPSSLEEWQQAKLQHVQKHRGEALDRMFTFGTVGGHITDLLKYRYEAENGQNEQLKQYAQQQIPVLERHLKQAREAAEQWVPEARTAGEHIRGNQENDALRGTNGTPNDTPAGTRNQPGSTGGGANQGINR